MPVNGTMIARDEAKETMKVSKARIMVVLQETVPQCHGPSHVTIDIALHRCHYLYPSSYVCNANMVWVERPECMVRNAFCKSPCSFQRSSRCPQVMFADLI